MIYLVNQGRTWEQERAGGFLWSPQLDKAGHRNPGYTLMSKVKKGDYILHNKGRWIAAISVVKADCYAAVQPDDVRENSGTYEWNDDGYRIDTEYFDFSIPVLNAELATWVKLHYHADSCFQRDGKIKQRYLCDLAEQDAEHIINEVLKLESDLQVKAVLYDAVNSIGVEDEYDDDDSEAIENLVNAQEGSEKHYSGRLKQQQPTTTAAGSAKEKPKRDPQMAANALRNAEYKCEFNPEDRTFRRKRSNKPYTEPHHLIPISKYKEFDYKVDVEENIVSLCSHCHNLLHYGCMEEKEVVLRKLYEDRIAILEEAELGLSFERLKSYYK